MARLNLTQRRRITRNLPNSFYFQRDPSQAYATITGDASFTTDIQDELCVALWAKFHGNLVGRDAYGSAGPTSNRNHSIRFNAAQNVAARISDGSGNQNIASTTMVKRGAWGLYGFSYKKGEHVRLFLDEKTIADVTPVIDLLNSVKDLTLSALTGPTAGLESHMAFFQVFGGSFTDAQWQDFYYDGVEHSGLTKVVDIDFTDAGPTLPDLSGNGNSAVVTLGSQTADSPGKPRVAITQARTAITQARQAIT